MKARDKMAIKLKMKMKRKREESREANITSNSSQELKFSAFWPQVGLLVS